MGLDFYDTDKLAVKALGNSLSFLTLLNCSTDKETQLLEELADTAERSVIATGGSVLSFDRNILILKRLGYILFIDRDPEILPASGRSRYVMKVNVEKFGDCHLCAHMPG